MTETAVLNEFDDTNTQLETASTLIDLVLTLPVERMLHETDSKYVEPRKYDGVPLVRALLCRELAGLSWNGLYEFLSINAQAVCLGFDPTLFGSYNTAPARQTLTTAWDVHLSDNTKRMLLAVSEELVTGAIRTSTHSISAYHDTSSRLSQTFVNDRSANSRMSRSGHTSDTLAKPSSGHSTPAVLRI